VAARAVVLVLTLALAGCAAPSVAPADGGPKVVGAAAGTYSRTVERAGRSIDVQIRVPEQTAPRPVVLFSHGLGADASDYDVLLTAWADAGYAVVAPLYPNTRRGSTIVERDVLEQPADASAVLDAVLADDELGASLDPHRVIAAGHSAGGITTLGLFTSSRDDRMRAGLVLSGAAIGVGADFSGDPAPILFVHGDADATVPYDSGLAAFEADPWPAAFLTLHGAGHVLQTAGPNDPYFPSLRDASIAFFDAAVSSDTKSADFGAIADVLGDGATLTARW
jgi:pimeloyl-ACP methyl ester carboxylesterase